MTEEERSLLIQAVRSEVSAATAPLSYRMDQLQHTIDQQENISAQREQRITNEISSLREESKRTREVAEKATRTAHEAKGEISSAYDAMKAHSKIIERQINGFEVKLNTIHDQNDIQLNTLTEIVTSQVTREERGQATKAAVDSLDTQVKSLVASEESRAKAEMVKTALEQKAIEQRETFWKRLPIYITLAVVISGVVFWFLNAVILQSRQQQINPANPYYQQHPQASHS